jgi:(E)-4-hydroxy-3-methylbut-2-enyl-diphosphate synthase
LITREIIIGNLKVGGSNPVRVQGMIKGSLDNPEELFKEAGTMVQYGAELIRCAIPEEKYAQNVYEALKGLGVPLIADCHFQSAIAIKAVKAGFDKVRVNPGNMSASGIKEAVEIANEYNIALRLGFNSGSCNADNGLELAKLALELDEKVKNLDFNNFVVSMKSSSVRDTVDANRYFSMHSDTPLHIGITATGPRYDGIIKSAMGLGVLLMDGVGDTVRVSLTGDSLEEIKVGCFLRDLAEGGSSGLETISCPTCSRAEPG